MVTVWLAARPRGPVVPYKNDIGWVGSAFAANWPKLREEGELASWKPWVNHTAKACLIMGEVRVRGRGNGLPGTKW
jgi:hypothetical protein